MVNIMLPFPPSVNGLFAGKKRRYKSDKYKAWLEDAKDDLTYQKYVDGFKWKNHTGKVKITLLLKAPDKRIRDLDNLLKAVLDFLVTHQVIVGDDSRYVKELCAFWDYKAMEHAGCFVIIEDLPCND